MNLATYLPEIFAVVENGMAKRKLPPVIGWTLPLIKLSAVHEDAGGGQKAGHLIIEAVAPDGHI